MKVLELHLLVGLVYDVEILVVLGESWVLCMSWGNY